MRRKEEEGHDGYWMHGTTSRLLEHVPGEEEYYLHLNDLNMYYMCLIYKTKNDYSDGVMSDLSTLETYLCDTYVNLF